MIQGVNCNPTLININCDYGKLSVVNSSDFTVIKNITLPTTSITDQLIAGPSIKVNSMIYNPNNDKIYVLISTKSLISDDENFIKIINGSSYLLGKTIDIGTNETSDLNFHIMNMVSNLAKNEIYVINSESKSLFVINSTSDNITKEIPLDFNPDKIFYNNGKIYLSIDHIPYSKYKIF